MVRFKNRFVLVEVTPVARAGGRTHQLQQFSNYRGLRKEYQWLHAWNPKRTMASSVEAEAGTKRGADA